MGASRLEQLIEDIYEFVESCKMQPLSSTKVVVPKDELYDLLDELRLRTPDEIKRYQKIIANRDAIITDAERKANTMLAEAQEKTNELISEHEIMQQAYAQANQIIEEARVEADKILGAANDDAHQIRTGSLAYSEEMLGIVESILQNAYDSTKSKYDQTITSIQDNLNIVKNNKAELTQQLNGPSEEAAVSNDPSNVSEEADYDLDDDYLDDLD
ncbi:archaeal/vacuolar-type H+-ATPase subunit H [Lachnospiraceae bacterium KM106-2]|nr:archaeal/vacuolar-type H+-ATPase subunit H [Lachnospiraceae bacterium KM106-2]